MNFFLLQKNNGFSLVETMVSIAIFLLVSISIYSGFTKIMQATNVLKVKNAATSLANEQIEIAKNLPYDDVGIIAGIPDGKIPREQTIIREGISFNVLTSVRDIDDPFDGQIGEVPNDLSPADYRLVEFDISCSNCSHTEVLKYYARISPLNLETQGNNGALFVRVFDSLGQPIQGADVHIENNKLETPVIIDETTNNNGMFQIVDAPTGTEAYEVTVTKGSNYSVDKTYEIGVPENPNPDRPHANVISGAVTQLSFYIDKLSEFEINTKKADCSPIGNVDFNLKGSKTIGYQVYKYNLNNTTNSSGFRSVDDIEWDSYNFDITDASWDLVGSSPVLPVDVNPDSVQVVDLVLAEKNPNSLQISVEDSETGLPVSDAEVALVDSSENSISLITGQGFVLQTDWSGGSGQEYFIDDETKFFSTNGNIEYQDPVGDIKLDDFNGTYINNGTLESSIIDIGSFTNFGHIFWNPVEQETSVGDESVRVQIATNEIITATTTWDFVGPDGAGSSYYTNSGEEISATHSGDRYLKYKIYLKTDDTNFTPIISNISFTFMTDCMPPGQVLFTGLDFDEYTIRVEHPDYQEYLLDSYVIGSPWQSQKINFIPN